jgi:hypothetical protein
MYGAGEIESHGGGIRVIFKEPSPKRIRNVKKPAAPSTSAAPSSNK